MLRHAYEMALQWVRQKPAGVSFAPAATVPVRIAARDPDRHIAPAPPQAAAPARDADTGASPSQLGQAVFDAFLVLRDQMAAQGDARDSHLWRKHLQHCAGDERLLNIAARAHFEFFIARLLANGWRCGHEGLFVAARQVFGWEQDRRRLLEFGRLGAMLNQAIDECEMFNHQQSGDCSGQADAVTRVRDDAAPSKGELITHVPHLHNMVARFPAWTAVIASRERIEQWMALEQAIPQWRRRLRFPTLASGTEKSGGGHWWKVVVLIMVVRALFSMLGSSSESHRPPPWNPRLVQPAEPTTAQERDAEAMYRRAAGRLYMPPGIRTLDPLVQALPPTALPVMPARPQGRVLNDAEMKAITKRIHFEWSPTAQGSHKVEFTVELDERGAIAKLTRKRSSGIPDLDKHVEDAIRASAPFGAQISRRFGLFYWWRREPAKDHALPPAPAATGTAK
ncbi:MAG: TonB C-terminal domain-containing protein [Pseudomonadota bacterium]|nr:TonB C-terminal domain-containing protein [Pseudomonadota bacterium]